MPENKLIVEFDNPVILNEWKNLIKEKYKYFGSIKMRVQELIEKDLKTLKKEIEDGHK